MKRSRLLFFLPSVIFACFWLHIVTGSIVMEKSSDKDLSSKEFMQGVGRAMDDPWLHHSALRLYFKRLLNENVSERIWAGSDMFARALWHHYQFVGSAEIMIVVSHAENNAQKELRWAQLYSATLPGDAHAAALMEHATKGHALGKPLVLKGQW